MKKIKRNNTTTKKIAITLIIVFSWIFLGIGHAYLNSSLKLSGTTSIPKTSWNIYFSNIVFKEGNVEATSPATIVNNTSLTMDVVLEKPGDTYSFDVDIINDGSIDAMLTEIFKTDLTTDQQKYLEYKITYTDGNEIKEKDALRKNSKDTITVTIQYKEGNTWVTEEQDLSLNLTLNYVQDDGSGNGTRIKYDLIDFSLGENNWYYDLTLSFQILEEENITSVKYCTTTDVSCEPTQEIKKVNTGYQIKLENNNNSQIVCLKASDKEGNEYSRCSNKYQVDGTKPSIKNVVVTPNDDTATIVVEGEDKHSGIETYYYSKDSGKTYVESKNPNYTFVNLEEGDYLITVYLKDKAGNISDATAKSTTIRHKSWCEKNNITNLADCIIATEQGKNTDIEEAKKSIVDKGTPNFLKTSPVIQYNEVHASTLSEYSTTPNLANQEKPMYIATEYAFDSEKGNYTLKNGALTDPTTIDYNIGEKDNKYYYTCGSTGTGCGTTMYRISSASKTETEPETGKITYKLSKYNYTSGILSYDNSESGLYATTDDEGISYYYRGSVGGNYVKFANKFWRIIRINGDNSVRIIYDGKTAHDNGESSSDRQIGTSAFNSWWSDNSYVGYMYGDTSENKTVEYNVPWNYGVTDTTKYYFGTAYNFDKSKNTFTLDETEGTLVFMTAAEYKKYQEENPNVKLYSCFGTTKTSSCQRLHSIQKYVNDTTLSVNSVEYGSPSLESAISNTKNSTMKTYLENWYTNNLESYTNKLYKNASFCNDREISDYKSGAYQNTGFGATPTIYGYERFISWGGKIHGPRLTCSNINDKFTTTDSTTGNKKLSKPIGLITADEVNMAGIRNGYRNQLSYLYTGTYYWTLSPSRFSNNGYANEFSVTSTGGLYYSIVNDGIGVRPVVNLDSSNLSFTGSGTKEDPYIIK